MSVAITPTIAPRPLRPAHFSGRGTAHWLPRVVLTLIAVAFLVLFVVAPAVNVFAQAFSKGARAYASTFYAPKVQGQEKLPLKERRALMKEQSQAEKTRSA